MNKKISIGLLVMFVFCAMTEFTATAQDATQNSKVLILKKRGNKYGYADEKGKMVIPYQFLHAKEFSEGFALIGKKKSGYGYINEEGVEVIPCQFDFAESFSDGMAAVFGATEQSGNMMIGRWGFVNTKGELVIPFQYREVKEHFRNGEATVILPISGSGSKQITIDKTGKEIQKE